MVEWLVVAAALAFLVGCGGFGAGEAPPPPPAPGPGDAVAQQLAAAAGRAEAALGRLSRIEASAMPIDWSAPPELVPAELMKPVTLDWTGPLGALTERLAAMAGYEYVVAGAAPVRPVIVDVHVVDKPLIGVFREAGYQAGTRAKVVVNAARGVVEVVHRGQ